VIVADDLSVHAILASSLSDADKLALLPVTTVSDFSHLCLNIVRSWCWQQHDIATPAFLVVQDREALHGAAKKMAFPFMLKGDFSSSGRQTYACASQTDVAVMLQHFDAYPARVQQKISGEDIGIEVFYQRGAWIHFAYSRVLKTENNRKFAPFRIREFTQTGAVPSRLSAKNDFAVLFTDEILGAGEQSLPGMAI